MARWRPPQGAGRITAVQANTQLNSQFNHHNSSAVVEILSFFKKSLPDSPVPNPRHQGGGHQDRELIFPVKVACAQPQAPWEQVPMP